MLGSFQNFKNCTQKKKKNYYKNNKNERRFTQKKRKGSNANEEQSSLKGTWKSATTTAIIRKETQRKQFIRYVCILAKQSLRLQKTKRLEYAYTQYINIYLKLFVCACVTWKSCCKLNWQIVKIYMNAWAHIHTQTHICMRHIHIYNILIVYIYHRLISWYGSSAFLHIFRKHVCVCALMNAPITTTVTTMSVTKLAKIEVQKSQQWQ